MKRTDLKTILQDKGVYILAERNADICKALVATAQDEILWSIDDPKNPRSSTPARLNRPILS
jgi:hypothetical protein